MVKNPPSNAGDVGSILGRGTKIEHAMGQLSPHATTTEPVCSGAHAPHLVREAHVLQLEKPGHLNEEPVCCNKRSHMLQRRSHVPQLRPDTAKINK